MVLTLSCLGEERREYVNRVLPREVAQAVMVPTTLVSHSLVRDVGKELPRDGFVFFVSYRVD